MGERRLNEIEERLAIVRQPAQYWNKGALHRERLGLIVMSRKFAHRFSISGHRADHYGGGSGRAQETDILELSTYSTYLTYQTPRAVQIQPSRSASNPYKRDISTVAAPVPRNQAHSPG